MDEFRRNHPEEKLLGITTDDGRFAKLYEYSWGYTRHSLNRTKDERRELVPGEFELLLKRDGAIVARRKYTLWQLKEKYGSYDVPFSIRIDSLTSSLKPEPRGAQGSIVYSCIPRCALTFFSITGPVKLDSSPTFNLPDNEAGQGLRNPAL